MSVDLLSSLVELPVSVAEVKDFLKITSADEDALLTTYVRAAVAACEAYTERKLLSQQWRVTMNDWGDGDVTLPLSPIRSLDKIEVWQDGAFVTLDLTYVQLDLTSYEARLIRGQGYDWPDPARDVAGIQISLTVGMGTYAADLPADMRHGLLLWVAAAYDFQEDGADSGRAEAEKLWRPYRRMVL